jgi:hypothetical protein
MRRFADEPASESRFWLDPKADGIVRMKEDADNAVFLMPRGLSRGFLSVIKIFTGKHGLQHNRRAAKKE